MNKQDFIEEKLKKFKCIQSGCDNNGTIAVRNQEGDWEPEQCQFCDEYILPLKDLIKEAIQFGREEREGEIKKDLLKF